MVSSPLILCIIIILVHSTTICYSGWCIGINVFIISQEDDDTMGVLSSPPHSIQLPS